MAESRDPLSVGRAQSPKPVEGSSEIRSIRLGQLDPAMFGILQLKHIAYLHALMRDRF
jgi:hypothetical protein